MEQNIVEASRKKLIEMGVLQSTIDRYKKTHRFNETREDIVRSAYVRIRLDNRLKILSGDMTIFEVSEKEIEELFKTQI